jgi:hypothetical protein
LNKYPCHARVYIYTCLVNSPRERVQTSFHSITSKQCLEFVHSMYSTVGYQSRCRFQNRSEKTFKTANVESLPRPQKLVFSHESFNKAILYVNYMYAKFQGQKIHWQKVIQNLPTLVDVEKFSLMPTLTTSQISNYLFFAIKFLEQKHLYVNNIWQIFKGQKN